MEDEALIGVFIRGYEFWKSNKHLICPMISIYLIDKENGECICKVNYNCTEDLSLPSLISVREKFLSRRPSSPIVNRPLFLEEKLTSLYSNEKILLFEINQNLRNRNCDAESKRIAWAFLIPVATDGSENINKELKLQLYDVQKSCKISHQTCNIYHIYKEHKLKKYPGVLAVKVQGLPREKDKKEENPFIHSMNDEVKTSSQDEIKDIRFPQVLKWSRLPTQSCKIPNQLHMTLSFGHHGSSCVRFSQTGTQIAISASEHIFIYDITFFNEQFTLKGHDGYIYDMDWSENDNYLLSVSNDCTCIVWNLKEKSQNFVLPHPSFVYCGKWITPGSKLVTGCNDHLMRCWVNTGKGFELTEEIRGHSGFLTSIALLGESNIISGDSKGCIIIHKFHKNKWSIMKQLELSETSFGIIDSIHVCNSKTRVIVTSRSKGSFMVDLNIGIITQKYKSLGNVVLRSVPCLTPCGSLFFAFCQNGDVGVWNAHTSKRLASYENLFPVRGTSEICGYMHYNPFEHMIAVGAFDHDYPVLILKYGLKDESKKLGLVFNYDKPKLDNKTEIIQPVTNTSRFKDSQNLLSNM